jgi:hypothetical protein
MLLALATTSCFAQVLVPILINSQMKMEQIILRFWNERLQVGMKDWRTAYLFYQGLLYN